MDGTLRNMTSIYITSNDKMLMLYRVGSRVVSPSWCGIGGHFEKDELNDAKAAILRELYEEINLKESDIFNVKLKYVTLRYKNNEIRINYYFFAELCDGVVVQNDCDEGNLKWINFDDVLDREMPYTAKHMLNHYMNAGRHTNLSYCGVAQKNGLSFVALEEF